jgi:hypothetical protein
MKEGKTVKEKECTNPEHSKWGNNIVTDEDGEEFCIICYTNRVKAEIRKECEQEKMDSIEKAIITSEIGETIVEQVRADTENKMIEEIEKIANYPELYKFYTTGRKEKYKFFNENGIPRFYLRISADKWENLKKKDSERGNSWKVAKGTSVKKTLQKRNCPSEKSEKKEAMRE